MSQLVEDNKVTDGANMTSDTAVQHDVPDSQRTTRCYRISIWCNKISSWCDGSGAPVWEAESERDAAEQFRRSCRGRGGDASTFRVDQIDKDGRVADGRDEGWHFPEFVPVRDELLELARYWASRVIELTTYFVYDEQISGVEGRIIKFGRERLDEIAELLGREAVEAVWSEVARPYKSQMRERDWAICMGEPTDDDLGERGTESASPAAGDQPNPADADFFGNLKKTRKSK
jgi:hypothetical protein